MPAYPREGNSGTRGQGLLALFYLVGAVTILGEIQAKKISITVTRMVTIQSTRSYFSGVRRRIVSKKNSKTRSNHFLLGLQMITDKRSLLALQRGERLSNAELLLLARKGLIQIDDVTNMDSPPGEREHKFTSFTERGRRLLET